MILPFYEQRQKHADELSSLVEEENERKANDGLMFWTIRYNQQLVGICTCSLLCARERVRKCARVHSRCLFLALCYVLLRLVSPSFKVMCNRVTSLFCFPSSSSFFVGIHNIKCWKARQWHTAYSIQWFVIVYLPSFHVTIQDIC